MPEWDPAVYGDRIADLYDQLYPVAPDVEAAADALARLVAGAGGGPALELGVGTGRLALALAGRGVAVHGVDASAAMVAKLRAKPGGDAIPVTVGDFTTVPVGGRFSVVFCAFNTFFHLAAQDDQVRCIASVAEHLVDGGAFVLECFVPAPDTPEQGFEVRQVEPDRLVLWAWRHDAAAQVTTGQLVFLSEAGTRLCPWRVRHASPPELDLMARLAGLELESRWADWEGGPFGRDSLRHVSVYRRSGPPA